MAGHSKWANIRFRKNRQDSKKGKIFSRYAKEIISAVKIGGPDPKANPRLRLVLQKAKEANVPNDVIDRNIKKASSPDQGDFHETTFEIYAHGGVGILVEALTDNKNRLISELRIAMNKKGGTLASPGAVSYNFDKKGLVQIQKNLADEESLIQALIEAGAADFEELESHYLISTDAKDLDKVKEQLISDGIEIEQSSIEMVPKALVPVDSDTVKANIALIERLDEIDDVDNVYHNMEIPDELD